MRLTSLAALVLAASLSACGAERQEHAGSVADTLQVTIEEFEYREMPDGDRILSGTLYNPTRDDVAHAQIQVTLYDDGNQRVDSMIIPIRNLPAGDRKSFEQFVDSRHDVRGARPRSVIVW